MQSPSQRLTQKRFKLVALTGGQAAGKSSALAAFARNGAAVLSSDQVVHKLYEDPAVIAKLTARWGDRILKGGEVDRAVVAEIVFSDQQERNWLEAMFWPLVGQGIRQWIDDLIELKEQPQLAVIEVPLLFESGLEKLFDEVVAVVTDEQLRKQRAQLRGGVASEQKDSRQLSPQEKAARADRVVVNNGTLQELETEIGRLVGAVTLKKEQ